MKKKIIIIPDVHGRTFWTKIKEDYSDDMDIIFLGDYLDPYNFENISKEDAFMNFDDIIDFKKEHPDNVTLLIGNHDAEYFIPRMTPCRQDRERWSDIKARFLDNIELFSMGTIRKIGRQNYSFTHSCILKEWVTEQLCFNNETTIKDVILKTNEMLQTDLNSLGLIIKGISFSRGGYEDFGSMVWADLREVKEDGWIFKGWYQIFGHSQQFTMKMVNDINEKGYTDKLAPPVITPYFACLDCKQIFELTENKKIIPYKKEEE